MSKELNLEQKNNNKLKIGEIIKNFPGEETELQKEIIELIKEKDAIDQSITLFEKYQPLLRDADNFWDLRKLAREILEPRIEKLLKTDKPITPIQFSECFKLKLIIAKIDELTGRLRDEIEKIRSCITPSLEEKNAVQRKLETKLKRLGVK